MYAVTKRSFDFLFSMIMIIMLSPLMLITAIGIKASSQGPVLYIVNRAGKNGRPFRFYKFRSMHLYNGPDKELFVADTERVFPFGRFIRKTKFDELPQLLNVLLGQMSFVGPRPMETKSVGQIYCGHYRAILDIKPGLTSYASLFDYTHGDAVQDDTEYREKILPIRLEMELLYMERQSFGLDLLLYMRTAGDIALIILGKKQFAYPKEYYISKDRLNENLSAARLQHEQQKHRVFGNQSFGA